MTEPIANKIGVANLGTVYNQTNHITIQQGQEVSLIYSDPVPDLRFFQGRGAEQAELNGLLADAAVALVGVRGEGGIGKSTLMAKVFAESLGFAGKFWADVRTGSSMAAVAGRALQELGVPPAQVEKLEEKDLIPRLLRLLQQGRYLLAIDNLESVLTATGDWQSGYDQFLEGFQDLGSGSVLLLGSREYPPKYFGWRQSRWLTVEHGLEPTEGAALLAALEVEDTLENRVAVSVQVQGNPLALALLAGWLRQEYRPGDRTVERLKQADMLQLEGRHRGESQVSVERVLQWSLDRLPLALQHLITQVSVLRGAFNATVAAALLPEQPVTDANLDELERRSLLQTLPERDKYGLRTFRLQPRIREFVQKRAVDLTAAQERAIHYFWNSRQVEFATEDTLNAITEYEETFYHQCQLSLYPDALRTVMACNDFLRKRGYYQILIALYTQLYTDWQPIADQRQSYAYVCRSLGNVHFFLGQFRRAVTYIEQSLTINAEIANHDGEAKSLNDLGDTYQSLGQYEQALLCHGRALIISQEIGDQSEEAFSLNNLGTVYNFMQKNEQGIYYLEQSLAIEQELGHHRGEANSLMNLGNIYNELGQHERAIDFQKQSLAIMHQIGDRNGEAKSLGNLGNCYHSLEQHQQAIAFHQQSLEISREIGDRNGEAKSLGNLGNCYHSLEQHQQAIAVQQQSLTIQREIGDRSGEATSLGNLGIAYYSLGQYQQAIVVQQQSLAIMCEIGDRMGEANSLGNLGVAYDSLGQYQQEIAFQRQALEIRREIGDRMGEAASLDNLGTAYYSLGQYQQAIAFQQQALEIRREIGDRWGEGTSLFNLGKALAQLDHKDEAIALYQQSLAVFEALELDHMVEKCKTAIEQCTQPIPIRQRLEWWQKWGLWFAVGLAIALLIWWLR